MPFGEIVIGAPGSGKSTYCHGKHQLFTALDRPISIVNLDPANFSLPYPCALSISSLITLPDVMDRHGLGPNGALIYCMEYLEENFDWLEEGLGRLGGDAYVVFDLPGQVELSTNHESLRRIIARLGKAGFRLAAVHLCDAHYITDASKYVSVLLLSLRAMLQLELPHINVLSKIDLLSQYGDLDFPLDFYTSVLDLSHLSPLLHSLPPRFSALTTALISLIEDYALVSFEPLAVEDKQSMLALARAVDRANGYVFIPPSASTSNTQGPPGTIAPPPSTAPSALPNTYALFSTAASRIPGLSAHDVQERWVDEREAYDAFERRMWREEGERLRAGAGAKPEMDNGEGMKIRERTTWKKADGDLPGS